MLRLTKNSILIAALLSGASLSGQSSDASSSPPAAPAVETETTGDYRDKALLIDEARPAGAFGRESSKSPTDTWLDAGSTTARYSIGALGVLLVLAWWRRRRSVRYC